ncbi:MAG: hypothetical protein IIC13_13490 [SAR324 cluster bacterium]|nr:hypothetical protein [SAR324 cluster bacterium]MCH8887593.1 hypothetical protein [SAR324 cluster bacterium]
MKPKIDPATLTSRRFFLAEGTRLFTMAGVGGALIGGLGLADEAQAQGWRSLFRRTPKGGHGNVKKMIGEASAGGGGSRWGTGWNRARKSAWPGRG